MMLNKNARSAVVVRKVVSFTPSRCAVHRHRQQSPKLTPAYFGTRLLLRATDKDREENLLTQTREDKDLYAKRTDRAIKSWFTSVGGVLPRTIVFFLGTAYAVATATVAFMSPSMFDYPGTAESTYMWFLFLAVVAQPVAGACTCTLALLYEPIQPLGKALLIMGGPVLFSTSLGLIIAVLGVLTGNTHFYVDLGVHTKIVTLRSE